MTTSSTTRLAGLRDLVTRFATAGTVVGLYVRPARGVAAVPMASVRAVAGRGLDGDRIALREPRDAPAGGGRRQLTLLQAEHLPLIAAWSGRATIDAAALRRNVVVAGINLAALRSPFADVVLRVRLGEAAIVVTGDCAPCSKMEDALGRGTYNALRGHGGVTARVVEGGTIRVGDAVRVEAATVVPE